MVYHRVEHSLGYLYHCLRPTWSTVRERTTRVQSFSRRKNHTACLLHGHYCRQARREPILLAWIPMVVDVILRVRTYSYAILPRCGVSRIPPNVVMTMFRCKWWNGKAINSMLISSKYKNNTHSVDNARKISWFSSNSDLLIDGYLSLLPFSFSQVSIGCIPSIRFCSRPVRSLAVCWASMHRQHC